jgi:16S rRNA (uracil1498-N3)-methyltransferase
VRRYHLDEAVGEGRRSVRISGKDHHYLSRVLRLEVGDELDAADSEGRECRARLIEVRRDELVLEVWRAGSAPGRPPFPAIRLFQCLPKGAKMDIIVRQATEAGVSTIVPVRSARTVPEPSSARLERWRRVAVEALQQCGRRAPPEILDCIDLGDLARQRSAGSGALEPRRDVFCHEDPAGAEPLHLILDAPVAEVGVLVGPEGGLDPEEVRLLRGAGFRQAYLGPNVLRAETAATVAVGAIAILLLERETWTAAQTGESASSTSPSTP